MSAGDSKVLHKGQFLQLMDRDTWEYVDRFGAKGVVALVAVTDEKNIILIEQYRAAVDTLVIEPPGGLIGDDEGGQDEAVVDAARRELEEETGFHAERIDLLAEAGSLPGLTSEALSIVKATGLTKVSDGGGEESEDITVHEIPIEAAPEWLVEQSEEGKVIDARVYGVLWFANTGEIKAKSDSQ